MPGYIVICRTSGERNPQPVRAAALPEQPQQPSNSAQQPQPRRLPVPSPPSWPCPAARACGLPAADRAGPPRAWGASGTPWPGLRQAGSVGRAGRPQARAPAGARWQGVGGRGRVGLREKWLYFSYTPLSLHHFLRPSGRVEDFLAQTHRYRGNFDQLIVVDKPQGLLQIQRANRYQTQCLI